MANLTNVFSHIKNKLVELNYILECTITNDGCSVRVPLKNEYIDIKYTITGNKVYYNINNGLIVLDSRAFSCPKYATGSVILADIFLSCKTIGYNAALIIFRDINSNEITEEQFLEQLPVILNPADNIRCQYMKSILLDVVYNTDIPLTDLEEKAKKLKISRGYKLVLSILGAKDEPTNGNGSGNPGITTV